MTEVSFFARFGAARRFPCGSQDVGQAERAHAGHADLQEATTIQTVAVTSGVSTESTRNIVAILVAVARRERSA